MMDDGELSVTTIGVWRMPALSAERWALMGRPRHQAQLNSAKVRVLSGLMM